MSKARYGIDARCDTNVDLIQVITDKKIRLKSAEL